MWHRRLWLIDHGASLYFHHQWDGAMTRSRSAFAPIREHVLLRWAAAIREADAELAPKLTKEVVEAIVALIPGSWLDGSGFSGEEAHRNAYRDWLLSRLTGPREWVEEALRARALLL
jgi:hypothetical protein